MDPGAGMCSTSNSGGELRCGMRMIGARRRWGGCGDRTDSSFDVRVFVHLDSPRLLGDESD